MSFDYFVWVIGVKPAQEQNPGRLGDDGEADGYGGMEVRHWDKGPMIRERGSESDRLKACLY